MFNKLEARVLSEYKRSRAAPSTFCTLIKHYFSFIKHYVRAYSFVWSRVNDTQTVELSSTLYQHNILISAEYHPVQRLDRQRVDLRDWKIQPQIIQQSFSWTEIIDDHSANKPFT